MILENRKKSENFVTRLYNFENKLTLRNPQAYWYIITLCLWFLLHFFFAINDKEKILTSILKDEKEIYICYLTKGKFFSCSCNFVFLWSIRNAFYTKLAVTKIYVIGMQYTLLVVITKIIPEKYSWYIISKLWKNNQDDS